jgi:DNA-binding transcriptional LysR family regulator
MLDIHELQVFLMAAETENFSQAGRRLSVSQPAVSMQVRALETRLGIELFHRSGRNVALTEAGRALVPMARELVNRAIQVEEVMASMQGEVTGLLRLGCSTTAGKYVLPKLIAGLRERHHQVQVVCDIGTQGDALQMLLDGGIQIAITSLCEPHKDIEYRPFLTDRIVLIAPPDHPWAQDGRAIQPDELVNENIILREEDSGTLHAIKQGLAWHNLSVDSLNVVMVLCTSEAIRVAVQERIGVSFVSKIVAAEAVGAGLLAIVDVEGMELGQTLYLARHVRRPATSAQTAFWDYAFAPENEAIRRIPE